MKIRTAPKIDLPPACSCCDCCLCDEGTCASARDTGDCTCICSEEDDDDDD